MEQFCVGAKQHLGFWHCVFNVFEIRDRVTMKVGGALVCGFSLAVLTARLKHDSVTRFEKALERASFDRIGLSPGRNAAGTCRRYERRAPPQQAFGLRNVANLNVSLHQIQIGADLPGLHLGRTTVAHHLLKYLQRRFQVAHRLFLQPDELLDAMNEHFIAGTLCNTESLLAVRDRIPSSSQERARSAAIEM